MRYLNWDVLLFPQEGSDTRIPLQEFKTGCDVVQDSSSDLNPHVTATPAYFSTITRPLPTVSCYVPTLPVGFPFRVSLHCWTSPEVTKATASLVTNEISAAFEARVLFDGLVVASLVFGQDVTWPQIIDITRNKQTGKEEPLTFPPFHSEMLSQAWVIPGQAMGRIKVIIAEGVYRGAAGLSPFEITRNLVAFSFQHTPLYILEDAGIAWPNPGMFFQTAAQQGRSPFSPRRTKEIDPDSHAHSPRNQYTDAQRTTAMSSNLPESCDAMPPPAFRVPRNQGGDPYLPRYGNPNSDPFTEEQIFQAHARSIYHRLSSSGDISMPDRPPKSRFASSENDQSMADFSRVPSPVGSFRSYPMPDYSRPISPVGNHTRCDGAPSSSRTVSPRSSKQLSTESWRHSRPSDDDQGLGSELTLCEIGLSDFQHQLDERMANISPRKPSSSGISAPANTRVSSASNTPPAGTKPSAAAEARASSYSGKARTTLSAPRDSQQTSHTGKASDKHSRYRSIPHETPQTPQPPEDEDDSDPTSYDPVVKTPSDKVISKKEGKSSSNQLEHRRLAEPIDVHNKENIGMGRDEESSGGDLKRRRFNSQGSEKASLGTFERKCVMLDSKTRSRQEDADGDHLKREEVVNSEPLGHIENIP